MRHYSLLIVVGLSVFTASPMHDTKTEFAVMVPLERVGENARYEGLVMEGMQSGHPSPDALSSHST